MAAAKVAGAVIPPPLMELVAWNIRQAESPYFRFDYAHDAAGVLDAIQLSPVVLAGYSFGGMMAQEVATLWLERVSKWVLIVAYDPLA